MKFVLKGISDFLFPPRCPCCIEVGVSDEPCEDCRRELNKHRIVTSTCDKCGNNIKDCNCDKFNNLFAGISGVFWNEGLAQDSVYSIKFLNRPYAADYFGRQTALCFSKKFPHIKPDVVIPVPESKKSVAEREYNQAELLAKSVASRLSVPLDTKSLIKVKENKKQHKLNSEERRANVKGVYAVNNNFSSKTVLLIDDVKTTGITLSECAKQLRLNGADEVYCAVVLITCKGTCNSDKYEI